VILIPIPENVDEALAKLIGDVAYGREEGRRAEEAFEGDCLTRKEIFWLGQSFFSVFSL